jgi:hypothetical protein
MVRGVLLFVGWASNGLSCLQHKKKLSWGVVVDQLNAPGCAGMRLGYGWRALSARSCAINVKFSATRREGCGEMAKAKHDSVATPRRFYSHAGRNGGGWRLHVRAAADWWSADHLLVRVDAI